MKGVAAAAAIIVVALGIWPPAVLQRGAGTSRDSLLVLPTEPYVLIPAIALAAAVCAIKCHWYEAIFWLAAPAVAVALNTWVLKPLFDRPLHDYLAYPSGHTVSLVATLTVLVLLVRQRIIAIAAATAITAAAGFGLIDLGYHRPVDVVGGAATAVAVVLTLWLATRPWRVRSAGSPHASTSSGNPPAASLR